MGVLGCQAAFRSQQGKATSPSGMASGTTNSLHFSDEGGVLSQLGLSSITNTLGALATIKSISYGKSHLESRPGGLYDVTPVTIEVDPTLARKVDDTNKGIKAMEADTSNSGGQFASNLDIAARTLGGDTSGAQYDAGYAYHVIKRTNLAGYGVRFYLGAGYGHYTFHDRDLPRIDRGPPMTGDGTYAFLGATGRLGLFLFTARDYKSVLGTETFVSFVGNVSDNSQWAIGQRLQVTLGFIEVELRSSGLNTADRSICVELGLGI
ncbi:hypothetical protein BH11MYX2_BH11MYX2_00780 [soil metagenome]